MSKEKQKPLPIQEYFDWVSSQKFKNDEDQHHYVSQQEQDFLQFVIYPMFYPRDSKHQTAYPYPSVLKKYSNKKPIYVIDNNFYTIIFCSCYYLDDTSKWEVSVHVKNHNFCDDRIISFATWFKKYYIPDMRSYYINTEKIPQEFLYPQLDPYSKKITDFCIELWGREKDFLLFKLCDVLRPF